MSKYTPEACARAGIPFCQPNERERYEASAEFARELLWLCEPQHSAIERSGYRALTEGDPQRASLPVSMRRWYRSWRSLPDYDGPPMRAPSGIMIRFVRETREEDGELVFGSGVVPIFVVPMSDGNPLQRLLEAHLVKQHPQKKREIPDETFYLPPSEGGRGWCKGMASEWAALNS